MEEKQPSTKLPESEEQEKVIKLLEERLEKHDKNRKVVQDNLTEIQNELIGQIDKMEERINMELDVTFTSEDSRLQAALNELRENNTISALQKAKIELSVIQSYEIIMEREFNFDLTNMYDLIILRHNVPDDGSVEFAFLEVNDPSSSDPSNAIEKSEIACDPDKLEEERERLIKLLEERLEEHDDDRKTVKNKAHEVCEELKTQIDKLGDRFSKELEGKYAPEDNRLQTVLNELRTNNFTSTLQKAKAELIVEQLYEIIKNKDHNNDITKLYELKAERRIVSELMEVRKLTNVRVAGVNRGSVSVQFTSQNPDEERVLSRYSLVNPTKYKCLFFKKGNKQEGKKYILHKKDDGFFVFTPDSIESETSYGFRVKMMVGYRESEWSDGVAEFTTPEFNECCAWKKCPGDVDRDKKYSVDERNPRISVKNGDSYCTIIGNAYILLNTVTSWSVKILKSRDNGSGIYIGVAPNDINQINENYNSCGWYFDCYFSELFSGPPHYYSWKEYGPRKRGGQYVHIGDSVGVVMDTTKGELSFILNNVNHGVAYEGIPLDKPLVPCVILWNKGDSVELII